MKLRELFRVAAAALTRHKLRAFLTLLGVIFGVATVVAVVSVISGLNSYVREKVFALNPDVVIFTKFGIITSRDEFLAALKRRDLTMTDMEIVRRECRLCTQVGGRGERPRTVKYGDRKLRNVQVQGHTANMNEAMSFDIASGRYFTKTEYDLAAGVAVIGWDVQDELFPNQDPDRPRRKGGRLSRHGHRHARQTGQCPGPKPGQRALHAPDAVQQAHRAFSRHRHLRQGDGRCRGGIDRDG